MKKVILMSLLSLSFLTCCGTGGGSTGDQIVLDESNYSSYSSFKLTWIGVVNREIKCNATFEINSKYKVVKMGCVFAHTTFNTYYYELGKKWPLKVRVDFGDYFSENSTSLIVTPGLKNVTQDLKSEGHESIIVSSINGTIERVG